MLMSCFYLYSQRKYSAVRAYLYCSQSGTSFGVKGKYLTIFADFILNKVGYNKYMQNDVRMVASEPCIEYVNMKWILGWFCDQILACLLQETISIYFQNNISIFLQNNEYSTEGCSGQVVRTLAYNAEGPRFDSDSYR